MNFAQPTLLNNYVPPFLKVRKSGFLAPLELFVLMVPNSGLPKILIKTLCLDSISSKI